MMLVFVHINKTAGSTVRHILQSSYGARHCDVEPWHAPWSDPPFSTSDLRRVRKIYPNLASIAGHRVTGHVDLAEPGTEFRYFTFMRDPLRTCASRFQYQIDHRGKTDIDFERWIQKDWVRNAQTRRIGGSESVDDAIDVITRREMFIGLAEHFDESLVLLKALRADDLNIDYTPVNVARRNTLATDLLAGERTRAMLAEANRSDLRLYQYVRDEVYPALRQEYGGSLAEAVADYHNRATRLFDRRRLALYRLKQHGVYRPMIRLYRTSGTRPVIEKLVA